MTDRKIVQALTPFSCNVDGVPVMIAAGGIYSSDDPAVRLNPNAFGDVEVLSSRGVRTRVPVSSGSVETASAEPGGRRRLTRKNTTNPETEKPAEPSEV